MIGNRIRILREEKGLKQEELAKKICVSPSAIGMYERNSREPNNELTIKLANFFNVSTDYLLGKTDKRNYDKDEMDFRFAYHKEMEGLTEQEIKEALEFYKMVKNKGKENK